MSVEFLPVVFGLLHAAFVLLLTAVVRQLLLVFFLQRSAFFQRLPLVFFLLQLFAMPDFI